MERAVVAKLINELLAGMEYKPRRAEGVQRGAELWPVKAEYGELTDGLGDVGLDRGLELGVR